MTREHALPALDVREDTSRKPAPQPPRVIVGGLPTVSVGRRDFAAMMVADCLAARNAGAAWRPRIAFSSNGQGLALAGRDPSFRADMLQADWIHGDGQSVVFASRLTKAPLPERIATTDFFHDAAEAAIAAGLSFYIFGGVEVQNARAVDAIRKAYPSLRIAGHRHGFFGPDDEEAICADICRSGADVLWVGLGKPLQEHWCIRNRHRLNGVGWIKTCGGLYAFLAGDAPRSPRWMQDAALEWAYRLWKDPGRLWKRYLMTNPNSLYRLMFFTRRRSS